MIGFWFFACAKITYSPRFAELLIKYQSVAQLWDQTGAEDWSHPKTWERIVSVKKNRAYYLDQKQILESHDIELITFDDPLYPQHLKHIYQAPLVLFVQGNKQLLKSSHFVSIVGTRQATNYGMQITNTIVSTLSECQLTLVSGLAYGIDSQVHLAAEKCGLPSIGVVPAALSAKEWGGSKIVRENLPLTKHLFLSETLPDERLEKFHFAKRNRLIAGLSLHTIVIEAPTASGALITARYALDEGREVMVVPHTLINTQGQGCLHLLAQGATLISAMSTLPEQLGFRSKQTPSKKRSFHNEEASKVYDLLCQNSDLEHITATLQRPSSQILLILGGLILQGYVVQNSEGQYLVT